MKEQRHFGFTGTPLPKNAQGKSFFAQHPSYLRLRRSFSYLVESPGLGVLTADPGEGKTAAIRNLCAELPSPDYQVIYVCDTSVSSLELFRSMAQELGVRPSHRRGQLCADLKKALTHLVDERGNQPIVVVDEAQKLSDAFLLDLSSFLNFAFDSRDLFTLWLVGLPTLQRRLRQVQHAALRTRIASELRLEPLDRDSFVAAIDHAFKAVGATTKIVSDPAVEMLFRASRGTFRIASKLLRAALQIAREKNQTFIDEAIVHTALEELGAT